MLSFYPNTKLLDQNCYIINQFMKKYKIIHNLWQLLQATVIHSIEFWSDHILYVQTCIPQMFYGSMHGLCKGISKCSMVLCMDYVRVFCDGVCSINKPVFKSYCLDFNRYNYPKLCSFLAELKLKMLRNNVFYLQLPLYRFALFELFKIYFLYLVQLMYVTHHTIVYT